MLWGLIESFYRAKTTFNSFEDSVIKIANGELDTPIDIANLELLEELSFSVKKNDNVPEKSNSKIETA